MEKVQNYLKTRVSVRRYSNSPGRLAKCILSASYMLFLDYSWANHGKCGQIKLKTFKTMILSAISTNGFINNKTTACNF